MKGPSSSPPVIEPASVRAEAPAWVARLQSPERDAETERAFRRWFESDAAHAAAFDKATDIWEAIGGVTGQEAVRRRKAGPALAMAAALAVAVVGAGGAWRALDYPAYATKIGEQRTVRLADGSRIALNTGTKVVVHYSRGERRVRLVRGEALFDVAKNRARPFIVSAEGQEVRALGTSFVVRDEGKAVAVTLIEGKVAVTQRKAAADSKAAAPVMLTPGQRLRVDGGAAVRVVDRPRLEAVTAWRSGQILFDATPLSQAVAEMNRYSPKPLELETGRIGALRVSGIFKAGELDAFARTVSAQYNLALIQQPDSLLLAEATEPQ